MSESVEKQMSNTTVAALERMRAEVERAIACRPKIARMSEEQNAKYAEEDARLAALTEALRARVAADDSAQESAMRGRGLDAVLAAVEGKPVEDAERAYKAVAAAERLRAEADRLRAASTGSVVATPDGPHYRTAVQTTPGERVEYMPAQTLAIARVHALVARSTNKHAWLQVTHNLGQTWADCADDGSPTEER